MAAHRGVKVPPEVIRRGLQPFVSVTGTPDTRAAANPSVVTLKLDHRIVPDTTYAGMYRIRYAHGSLSDMVNLTRAKDALLP